MSLAAAFWVSFFALYWLNRFGLLPEDSRDLWAAMFFLLGAAVLTLIAYSERLRLKK